MVELVAGYEVHEKNVLTKGRKERTSANLHVWGSDVLTGIEFKRVEVKSGGGGEDGGGSSVGCREGAYLRLAA